MDHVQLNLFLPSNTNHKLDVQLPLIAKLNSPLLELGLTLLGQVKAQIIVELCKIYIVKQLNQGLNGQMIKKEGRTT